MSLRAAIHAVRSAGLIVVKTGKNTGINAKYATYADVWEMLQPELARHQVAVGFAPGPVRKETDAWIQTMILTVTHGDEVETASFEILFPEGNRGVNLTQRQGMAHTYGRRYALCDFFHILTGDDDDAQRLGVEREHVTGATASDAAPWTAFLSGGWRDVPADDGRTLNDLSDGQRAKLWEKDPASKPLMAWVGDRISDRLQDAGYSWGRFVTWANAGLPATMDECTPGLLKIAATKTKEIPDQ